MRENIGFISTRFAGADGVSLEAAKWAHVLGLEGHACFWYAGKLDHEPAHSMCIPEAFFHHPENVWISERIWGKTARTPLVTRRIKVMAEYLRSTLYEFVRRFDLKIIVLENVLAIPMHVPLGLALAEFLSETHMPALGHHHDFYWERTRFSVNAVNDYLDMAFPSRDHDLRHVVISEPAQEELARRKGISAVVVPNVFDFERPPPPTDLYASDVRAEIGLGPEDKLILQPTRIVPRKGIHHALELVQMLGNPRYKLVIAHEAGDEGFEYRDALVGEAMRMGVDLRFFSTRVTESRRTMADGKKTYTLWDIYPHADFVTYPSLYEGFGNAFLEAVYFKKPLLVNRYGVFARDIEPKGFKVPIIEGFVSKEVVGEVRRLLDDPEQRRATVEHNYAVATRYCSYAVLRKRLGTLVANLRGLAVEA
jgi:mannosylglucosylglycerate synthase